MIDKTRYRVQFTVGMDSLHRDFSEAICAVRSYRRLARYLGGKELPNFDMCQVRLWDMNQQVVLISTESSVHNGWLQDKDIVSALTEIGADA